MFRFHIRDTLCPSPPFTIAWTLAAYRLGRGEGKKRRGLAKTNIRDTLWVGDGYGWMGCYHRPLVNNAGPRNCYSRVCTRITRFFVPTGDAAWGNILRYLIPVPQTLSRLVVVVMVVVESRLPLSYQPHRFLKHDPLVEGRGGKNREARQVTHDSCSSNFASINTNNRSTCTLAGD